jgi:hypothetical protein
MRALSKTSVSAIVRRMAIPMSVAALALAACIKSGSGSKGAAGSFGPCDPLTPRPVTVGRILGVGQDTQSTVYLADQAPDGGSQDRVFVSSGHTLYRKHVAGSAQNGAPPDADYSFSFQDPFADAQDLRALLIQVRGAAVTAMALGSGTSRSFYAPDAGDELLTLLGGGAIAGFKLQNLPVLIVYVSDVSNGDAIVVTEPMDPWDNSGFRLFYGAPSQMIERPIVAYNRSDGSDDVSFGVDGATYAAHFTFPAFAFDVDGGAAPPGPESLDAGAAGTLSMTQRVPTPTTLSGLSFTCLD